MCKRTIFIDMHDTAKRLLEIGTEQGAKDFTEIAKRLGGSDQSATNWKKRGIPTKVMIEAATIYGTSVAYLCFGIKPKYIGASTNQSPIEPGDNRLPIRRALFKLSAGVTGYSIEYENGESEPIFMGRRWFESNHYNPEKLVALKVHGQSMEPSLYDGDLVIVNTANHTPKDGIVFAINYEGEMVIKRMRREAGKWLITSDNQNKIHYPDKVCAEGCFVLGEVVYKQSERI